MASPLRQEVLKAFRNVHKARLQVFKGDETALKAARTKINEEFRKNRSVADPNKVQEMVIFANAVAEELRSSVVQAKEKSPGIYSLRISPESRKLDNAPFNPDVEIPRKVRKSKGRCGDCQCGDN